MSQLLEYNTFVDKGIGDEATAGYKKEPSHMIYVINHDGQWQAFIESMYSSIVVVYVAEPNSFQICGADIDIGNTMSMESLKAFVSKRRSYPQVWGLLKPLLFYSGDTSALIVDGDDESDEEQRKMQPLQECL
jgi:hypothetical protein